MNVIERLQTEHPRQDHRHRVEHLGVCPPDLQERVRKLKVIPVLNPSFPYEFGESYIHNYGKRTNYMYAAKQLLEQEIVVTAGSDAPITTANPFAGMYMAQERVTKGAHLLARSSVLHCMTQLRCIQSMQPMLVKKRTLRGA